MFGTVASRFNDQGTTALYQCLRDLLVERGLRADEPMLPAADGRGVGGLLPGRPTRAQPYLADIAGAVRSYHADTERRAAAVQRAEQVRATAALVAERSARPTSRHGRVADLAELAEEMDRAVDPADRVLLDESPAPRRRTR